MNAVRGIANGGVPRNRAQWISIPIKLHRGLNGPDAGKTAQRPLSVFTALVHLIDERHERVKLAGWIDWQAFADKWSPQFESTTGGPALLYLKHVYALSDEDVVERCCENPYWQHFGSERKYRHELPRDPSSLMRRHQRIVEGLRMAAGPQHRDGPARRRDQTPTPGRNGARHDGTTQGGLPIPPTAACSTEPATNWWPQDAASRCARAPPA